MATANESIKVSAHAAALQERAGEAIGFAESDRKGRASGSQLADGGDLEMSIVGTSPQGEEDTQPACRILLERLRKDGQSFDEVRDGSGSVDCVLSGPAGQLDVQVVRAVASQDLWRKLAIAGEAALKLTPDEVALALRHSIELKATEARIPSRIRPSLVLALDATRLPGLGFDAVVRAFRKAEGRWVQSLGFKAVWLVGPDIRLTWQLDAVAA